MVLDDLLSRRLVILSGKGGVGKSVVGTALALAAHAQGRRILFVEVEAPMPATRFLGERPSGPEPTEVRPGLWMVNIKPERVMDEYVRAKVPIHFLARKVVESPLYTRIFNFAPGLPDLMVLGKIMIMEEEQERWAHGVKFETIILDAPATGHGLAFLKAPVAAANAVPIGPVGNNARRIMKLLRDPARTALVVVAIPEEMAVVEALEFQKMARTELGIDTRAVVLNACHERRLSAAQEQEVLALGRDEAEGRLAPGIVLPAALAAARRHIRRRKLTQFYLRRLRDAIDAPLVTLPFLFTESIHEGDLETLAERLEVA